MATSITNFRLKKSIELGEMHEPVATIRCASWIYTFLLVPLLLSLVGTVANAAIVFWDSFDIGNTSISTNSSKVDHQETGLSTIQVIGGYRDPFISGSSSGTISIQVNTASNLGLANFHAPTGTSAFFGIDYVQFPSKADFTSVGCDRLAINVVSASPGATLEIWMRTPGFNNSKVTGITIPNTPGEIDVRFDQFSNVDFTNIEFARLLINAPTGGDFSLSSTQVVPEPNTLLFSGIAIILMRGRHRSAARRK